ncbi:sugar phosphate isomerase/epimerase family protein [Cyclobacterium sp.]|uniref:sugar phosphate isomerase/epimerase family protein n=1 Tax=Cyclobacterium sp. TaxID=1966343 RepID=UPI0019AD5E6A|nr:sugar phosphate isomerase/epimerase family protein [Cyclobacterium sp.]MBD3629970.1 sugar phosphate isomerase/epimerase [Cyclobacterium sp.]
MKNYVFIGIIFLLTVGKAFTQALPTGDSADFKVKTCLHSIGYSGLWRGQAVLSVDEFLVKASELGYDGVMLMAKAPHLSILDYDKEARTQLKSRIAELDLTLVGLAGYSDFTAGMDKPGIPHSEIQAAYIGQLAELAGDLGTKMIRIFTGYERPGIPYDKQYAMVVEGITLAAKEAQKYGVTLVVQNHHDIAIHHDAMHWLLKEINMPNVMSGWDAWSPTLEGLSKEEIRNSVLKMKPFLANTILADYRPLPRYQYVHALTNYQSDKPVMRATAMGEGIIDYENFIGALKEIGYQGYLVYEMCEVLEGGGTIENLDATAKKFLDYVKQFE